MKVDHTVEHKCFLAAPEKPRLEFRQCTSTDVCIRTIDARKLVQYLRDVNQFILDYNELCKERK